MPTVDDIRKAQRSLDNAPQYDTAAQAVQGRTQGKSRMARELVSAAIDSGHSVMKHDGAWYIARKD